MKQFAATNVTTVTLKDADSLPANWNIDLKVYMNCVNARPQVIHETDKTCVFIHKAGRIYTLSDKVILMVTLRLTTLTV